MNYQAFYSLKSEDLRDLNDRECNLLIGLTADSMSDSPAITHETVRQKSGTLMQIMISRIEGHVNIERVCTPHVLLYVGCYKEFDRPGVAVMWAATFVYWASILGRPVDLDTICSHFPTGVPTLESMLRTWDQQKVSGGNLLDDPEWWAHHVEKINNQPVTA